MLTTTNVAIQFGAKPLFEGVTVKFSDGNRYGLIGANGCGKSTLMKILGGELEQSVGEVSLQTGMRLGKLNQNQILLEAFSIGTQFLIYRMPSRTFLNEITGRPVVLFAFSGGSSSSNSSHNSSGIILIVGRCLIGL